MFQKISIIIPCYWFDESFINLTQKCLEGINEKDLEVIIVNDGSPLTWEPGEDYHLVTNQENKGYAGAVNAGLQIATGNILIICNNDIEFVDPHWLSHLLEPLQKGYDICSIRTTDSDGWEIKDWLEEGAKFGSIWAMRRVVYTTLGGLSEAYGKGYFEDLDYHRRAEDAGFKIVKNHNGLVEHQGKATFKVVDPKDTSYHESMGKFIQKWGMKRL